MTIIVHESTIQQIPSDKLEFVEYLMNVKTFADDHIIEMKDFVSIDEYKTYMRVFNYWTSVFKTLPKVKLDGRIKLGEYKLPTFKTIEFEKNTDGLYLVVRSSERYTNQIIELIYKQNG